MITIGSVLDGKYKILNQIGTGGMSTVYLAMNEKANRQWAVKEIKKDRPYNFALMKQGILREMEMLRTLHHPMIPRICDVIEKQDAIFIVMDYIRGENTWKTCGGRRGTGRTIYHRMGKTALSGTCISAQPHSAYYLSRYETD